jgi:hypothetical protein
VDLNWNQGHDLGRPIQSPGTQILKLRPIWEPLWDRINEIQRTHEEIQRLEKELEKLINRLRELRDDTGSDETQG